MYKSQQDAQVTEFILSDICSTSFGDVTITHLQEHKTTVTTPCLRQQPHVNKNRSIRHTQDTQISSNSSTIATDNNTVMYIIYCFIEHFAFSAEYTLSTTIVILI
jgi:hypothetical protein